MFLFQVRMSVFITLLKAFGYLPAAFIPLAICVFIGFNVGSGIWLSKWTDDPYLRNTNNSQTDRYSSDTYYYLGFYTFFSLMQSESEQFFIALYCVPPQNTMRLMNSIYIALLQSQTECLKRFIIQLAASQRRRGLTVASRLWLCIFKQSLRD